MRTMRWMVAGAVAAALAGCGADEIASPGAGGDVNIVINNPPPVDGGGVTPPPSNLATPAGGCPTIDDPQGLRNDGTISGPTGEYRVCTLPSRIRRNVTLARVPGVLYQMDGRVDVGVDRGPDPANPLPAGDASAQVTLAIAPGVIIYSSGVSWLAVNRGHRIHAVGTAERPIIFTSRDNVLGLATDATQGQWGGVVLLGRAPTTDCRTAGAPAGTIECERQTEGAVDLALFGGATPDDNSGRMEYVQIRYSGYVLSGDSELQSLTMGGVGSGTVISHLHTHNSSDDAFENFGGTVNMRHIVLTGADDDTIDVDTGWNGTIQYLIGVQKTTGNADSMIELDSANTFEDQQPRTHLRLANFTLVHRNPASGNNAAMLFRGKADATLVNGVLVSPMACLRLAGVNILTADPATGKEGPPLFRSVAMQCGGASPWVGTSGVTAAQVEAVFGSGANNNNSAFTASLTGGFINGANETGVTATNPQSLDPRFDATSYIGAVRDASDTWYAGWTCNSATANFGTTSGACTSLPSLAD